MSISSLLTAHGVLALTLGSALTSPVAIVIYLLIILASVAVVVISVLMRESGASKKVEYTFIGEQPGATNGKKKDEDEVITDRFCMLSAIDRKKSTYGSSRYDKGVTLKDFCENFRSYAANRLKLFYSIDDIRRFVSGMAVSKILILQGMSGTGKTSLAHAFGR